MKKYLVIILLVIIALAIGAFRLFGTYGTADSVFGNVSQRLVPCQTNSATTSPNYLSNGVGTTTLVYDFYTGTCDTTNVNSPTNPTLSDKAYLRVQWTPSSTVLSLVRAEVQHSEDGINWYDENFSNLATTAPVTNFITTQGFNIGATASTTQNRQAVAGVKGTNAATTTRIYSLTSVARYMRVIFSIAPGAEASALWAEIVGQKQR